MELRQLRYFVAVATFAQKHPKARVELLDLSTKEMLAGLENDTLDVALTVGPDIGYWNSTRSGQSFLEIFNGKGCGTHPYGLSQSDRALPNASSPGKSNHAPSFGKFANSR